MQVIFLVDLPFHLPLNAQSDNVRIALSDRCVRVRVDQPQCFLQIPNRLAGAFGLFLHRILEVPREPLDLLTLLVEVAPQACELDDHIVLDVSSFIALGEGLFMVVAKDVHGVADASLGEKGGRRDGIADEVAKRVEGF